MNNSTSGNRPTGKENALQGLAADGRPPQQPTSQATSPQSAATQTASQATSPQAISQSTSPQSTKALMPQVVDALSQPERLMEMFGWHPDGEPLPSGKAQREIIDLARAFIFPGFYGIPSVHAQTLKYHIGVNVERLHRLLTEQIMSPNAEAIATAFVERLPAIRSLLATDVEAAYNGDPAASSFLEIISCYPVIKCLVNYRIAHELLQLGVPLIPRMLTEMAHSETGIDIHPAAQIGHHFTIDHGTGVVIGETCIIGNHVKLYQGVTLGAKSFPLDADGNPTKGIPRHPILEDNVIVYSNATILGRITIGRGATVGANIWVTDDMKEGERKYKKSNE